MDVRQAERFKRAQALSVWGYKLPGNLDLKQLQQQMDVVNRGEATEDPETDWRVVAFLGACTVLDALEPDVGFDHSMVDAVGVAVRAMPPDKQGIVRLERLRETIDPATAKGIGDVTLGLLHAAFGVYEATLGVQLP